MIGQNTALIKMIQIAKKKHGNIIPAPTCETLEDGYVYHEDIMMHVLTYHVPGGKSSCAISLDADGNEVAE